MQFVMGWLYDFMLMMLVKQLEAGGILSSSEFL